MFFPATGGYGRSGVPDVVGCWQGRFFAIECKAEGKGGNTTALQRRELQRINEAGGVAFIYDGTMTEEELLNKLEEKK
jgi:Holliday junction resolvase